MNKITFPLKQDMQADAVADLQDALQLFLERGVLMPGDDVARREFSEALKRERIDRKYGSATSKLVSLFQQAGALQSTGEVDEATAKALNEKLQQFGVLDPPRPVGNADGRYVVIGELRRLDGLSLRGVRIRAVQEIDGAAIRMGEDTTDAQGHYTIRYERLPGPEGIDLRVVALREDGELLQSSELTHNAKPVEVIDLTVSADRKPAEQRRMEGRVLLEHGLPASQLTLRLYRLDFGGKAILLDETSTLTGGEYALAYDPGGKAASLELRAVNAAGEEFRLSGPLNDRSTESRAGLNLVAPATLQPIAAEYRRLSVDLAAHLGEMNKLAGARENDERQDLTILNRATGWDARLIALAATTERLTADADVQLPQEPLYGLLRAGLPWDKLALAQVEPDVAELALKAVRDARIVELSDPQIAEFKSQFARFATKARLNVTAPGSHATYGQLLQASGLSPEEQDKFAPVYLNHRGKGAALWDEARKAGLDEAQVRKLRLQGKLAYLAGNSEGMTGRLMQKQIDDPAELVEQDFHRAESWVSEILAQAGIPLARRDDLTEADTKKLAAEIPPAYASEDVKERLATYADDMARKVRQSYPTQVLTRLVQSGEVKLPVARDDTVKLMKNAAGQGFRLGETPVQAFLKSHRGVRAGMTDAEFETAGRQLSTLHRVYQITPSNEAMPVLMALNMTSAYDVMAYSEAEFTALYARKYFDLHGKQPAPSEPLLVYRKATQVSSVTYNLFTIARKMDSEPRVAGLSADVDVRDSVREGLVRQFPTMEKLFGSVDFCECEHCRSVLSPAAYLVDLLQFVDPEPEVWANFLGRWKETHGAQDYPHPKPYDVLIARRPDLPHIALTCENTHTALPHIDIVNEILEYYVAKGALDEGAAHDTGGATTEELLAEPQNVISGAYKTLSEAHYPLTLPFDLGTHTVRQFCDFFETPLTRLMMVFGPDSNELFSSAQAPDRFGIFMESLGLSQAELAIFIDPDPLAHWHELYGYASAGMATTDAVDAETGQRIDLNSAKTLARRLGVTYKELAQIIQTGFANPRLPGLALLPKLGVDIHQARFYLAHKALLAQDPATLPADVLNLRLEAQAFAQKLAQLQAVLPASSTVDLEAAVQAMPFDAVLVLSDTSAGGNFDSTTLCYADGHAADAIAFLRINLFVRLWRKLGWSIEETGRALDAFVPADALFEAGNLVQQPLRTALVYLAHLKALDQKLGLGKEARVKLLALWSDLPVTGSNPLYAQLFLVRSVLKSDAVFDDPLGQYLSGAPVSLIDHLPAVQGALALSVDEIGLILEESGQSIANAQLSLANLSQLYRYRLLARGLKLPIRDLLALRQLSGLDPFHRLHPKPLADTPTGVVPPKTAIELDYPFSQTLRFVEMAEQVKDSGFTLEALQYLLRHRFEPAGKYRPDTAATLALFKTLAEGIRAIRDEHAMPAAPDAVSDEVLRQKLGLALLPGVVARLLAMMNGAEFSAGTGTAREFFDDQLMKHAVRVDADAGFLDDADFILLFAPLQTLQEILATDTEAQARDKQLANDVIRQQNLTQLQRRRNRIAEAFLPFLRKRLIRQFVVQAMTAQTGADAVLVESLLTDERLVAGPLLEALVASGADDKGAGFFDASGRLLDLANARFDAYLEVPASGAYRFHVVLDKTNAKARLRFDHLPHAVLDATASVDKAILGDGPAEFAELKVGVPYRFTLELADLNGGSAQLLVQGETMPRAGISQLTLYRLEAFEQAERALVLLTKLLRLADGLGLNEREVRYLLAHEAQFERVELVPAPAVTGRSLGKLPTQASEDTPEHAQALFGRFLRWAAYAQLKRELAGGNDELIGIFEANEATDADKLDQKVYPLIARLTHRSEAVVSATAQALAGAPATPAFDSERPLQRLWQALRLVARFGVPAASLVTWAGIGGPSGTFDQRFEIARDLKESLKARVDPQAWQRLAQPIFDRLRQGQRDALAAFVMDKKQFASLERLYEEFLIDPGMEPVVQTSRIRLAISSLQLFIQRSLLNMERQVNPSVIDARHWDWMKRYRVWEANRKIFLFPENWLEPEFRDDKTHLFTELEGALLQADVSGDVAEDAFLDYLKKLDELARLDIVAMHMEDGAPEARSLHVIGRTYGHPKRHFYRRYARQMWTPWEPVTAEVQGDHLAPVVWRDRLYLFWVTFMDKPVANPKYGAQAQPAMPAEAALMKVIGDISSAPRKKRMDAQLHWSEYLDGKWGTPESSGFVPITRTLSLPASGLHGEMAGVRPDRFATDAGLNASPPDLALTLDDSFDNRQVFIHVSKAPYEAGEERGVYIHLRGGGVNQAFYVAGRNAAPESAPAAPAPANPLSSANRAMVSRYGGSGALSVEFRRHIVTEDGQQAVDTVESKAILQQCGPYTLLPCDNAAAAATEAASVSPGEEVSSAVQAAVDRGMKEIASLMRPVFFQDKSHTFFIEPSVTERTLEEWQDWVTPTPPPEPGWGHADWWKNVAVLAEIPKRAPILEPADRDGGFRVDPHSLIDPRPRVDWLVNPGTALTFDGVLIGPAGRPALQVVEAGGAAQSGAPVDVHPASGLASGSMLVLAPHAASLADDGLARAAGGLNIVGAGGFNAALARNLDGQGRTS